MCMCVSVSVCLYVCMPMCLPAYVSACLCACLPACLSACLPASLPACLPVGLCASVHVCVYRHKSNRVQLGTCEKISMTWPHSSQGFPPMIVMRSRTGDDVRSLEPTIIRLIDSSTAQDPYNAQSILTRPGFFIKRAKVNHFSYYSASLSQNIPEWYPFLAVLNSDILWVLWVKRQQKHQLPFTSHVGSQRQIACQAECQAEDLALTTLLTRGKLLDRTSSYFELHLPAPLGHFAQPITTMTTKNTSFAASRLSGLVQIELRWTPGPIPGWAILRFQTTQTTRVIGWQLQPAKSDALKQHKLKLNSNKKWMV